jgi:4-amino-4-deoxy-L-arabinose transferase-like glycosyltransferase
LGLRVFHNQISPPGLYVDEASIGYNAYSLVKTGRDEHNVAWPVLFQAFGDQKNPVFIYSLAPLLAVADLEVATVRLTAALWGVIGIGAVGWLAWELTGNRFISWLAAAVLTVTPWHVHYSRVGFEAISFATLWTIALACFWHWRKKPSLVRAGLAGASFGLTFYSYTTARFWVPVTLALLGIGYFPWLLRQWRHTLVACLVFLFCLIPALLWAREYPTSFTTRFETIAIWNDHPTVLEAVDRFWLNFWGHWSPAFLFGSGDRNIRHSSQFHSELLYSWGIFLVVGIPLLVRLARENLPWRLIGFLILTFPLAASLTRTNPIATRTIQVVPLLAIVIALGMWWCLHHLRRHIGALFLGLILGVGVLFFEFTAYYLHLLTQYPHLSWKPWDGFDGSLPAALTWAHKTAWSSHAPLLLSDSIEQAYIQGLFFTQADPRIWQDQRQAPFRVVSLENDRPLSGLAVLPYSECQEEPAFTTLKVFAPQMEGDQAFGYCVGWLKEP